MVSDPCYGLNTWCQGVLDNILSGEYECVVEHSDEGEWGTRVSAIEVRHKDYKDKFIIMDPESFEVGVDSGQAGIFDYEYYEKYHSDCKEIPHVDDNWYDNVGNKTFTQTKNPNYEPFKFFLDEPWEDEIKRRIEYEKSEKSELYLGKFDANTIDNLGFVSSSGYGDGGYTCWTARNDNNQIVGIRVEFITEDDEEEL